MTARNGLFVTQFDAGQGRDIGVTDPEEARLALSGLLQAPTVPGILWDPTGGNLTVTGTTSGPDMVYQVADGRPATLRSTGAGLLLWSNDGPVLTDAAPPAPGSGSRYDLIWSWGKDGSTPGPDTDSVPEFGVTTGNAAASNPTKPYADVPDGALVLAEALVAAGDADASQAAITMVAPFKVAAGAPVPVRNQAERDVLATYKGLRALRLDRAGQINTHDGAGWDFVDWKDQPITPAGWTIPAGQVRWQVCRRGMDIRFRGALISPSTFGSPGGTPSGETATFGNLPAGIPPPPAATAALTISSNTANNRAAWVQQDGTVQVYAEGASNAWFIVGGGYRLD